MSKNEKDDQLVTIRVPKATLEKFDKTITKGSRAEEVRSILDEIVAKSDGQPQVTVTGNYEKLKSDADSCRREMDRLKKAMGSKLEAIQVEALCFASLTAENVPLITRKLCNYAIKPEDGFDRGDVEDYIEYLEAIQKHDSLLKQIDDYRKAKFGVAESETQPQDSTNSDNSKGKRRRHINPKDLCGCGNYETIDEHNRRCAYDRDTGLAFADTKMSELKQRYISKYPGRPLEKLLQLISDTLENYCGAINTNPNEKTRLVEYLKANGTDKQKAMINSYFFWRLFPIPFPECQTIYKGKVVTEDLTCEELRSFLMTPEESKLGEIQLNLSKSITWKETDKQNNDLTELEEETISENETDSTKSDNNLDKDQDGKTEKEKQEPLKDNLSQHLRLTGEQVLLKSWKEVPSIKMRTMRFGSEK